MAAKLMAYYASMDRSLALMKLRCLPPHLLTALSSDNNRFARAHLVQALWEAVYPAMAEGKIPSLECLSLHNAIKPGCLFFVEEDFIGRGFNARNKGALRLTAKLDAPMPNKELRFDFSRDGLLNDTAYSRLSPRSRVLVLGVINDVGSTCITASPIFIGDVVDADDYLGSRLSVYLEIHPSEIDQLKASKPSRRMSSDLELMRSTPEEDVKAMLVSLLGEEVTPKDWGGELNDLYSAKLTIEGRPALGAFLLKGPSRFHEMVPADCGKNGDQISRLFHAPADVYVIQHCHRIGPAVREIALALALQHSFIRPCRIAFLDGHGTARLLRSAGKRKKRLLQGI